jgi:hypothetical protein
MGSNPGAINILRNPLWPQLKKQYNITDISPPSDWQIVTDRFWNEANKPWIDEAIARGDIFRFVSNPTVEKNLYVTDRRGAYILDSLGNRIKSIYQRELDYLRENGYTFLPDGTAVKY